MHGFLDFSESPADAHYGKVAVQYSDDEEKLCIYDPTRWRAFWKKQDL